MNKRIYVILNRDRKAIGTVELSVTEAEALQDVLTDVTLPQISLDPCPDAQRARRFAIASKYDSLKENPV